MRIGRSFIIMKLGFAEIREETSEKISEEVRTHIQTEDLKIRNTMKRFYIDRRKIYMRYTKIRSCLRKLIYLSSEKISHTEGTRKQMNRPMPPQIRRSSK